MPSEHRDVPGDEWERLKSRLLKPEALLKRIGAILVSDSKQAFERKALGNIAWPPLYPRQSDPFINVAWALKDFAAGRKEPLARRFSRDHPGIDTGDTKRATTFKVLDTERVQVGNAMPWANAMQNGGVEGVIPITKDAKARMGKWLRSKKVRASWTGPVTTRGETEEAVRSWAKANRMKFVPDKKGKANKDGSLNFTAQNPYLRKLGPLMKQSEYRIKGLARPFIGVTDETRDYMLRATADFLAEGTIP